MVKKIYLCSPHMGGGEMTTEIKNVASDGGNYNITA